MSLFYDKVHHTLMILVLIQTIVSVAIGDIPILSLLKTCFCIITIYTPGPRELELPRVQQCIEQKIKPLECADRPNLG